MSCPKKYVIWRRGRVKNGTSFFMVTKYIMATRSKKRLEICFHVRFVAYPVKKFVISSYSKIYYHASGQRFGSELQGTSSRHSLSISTLMHILVSTCLLGVRHCWRDSGHLLGNKFLGIHVLVHILHLVIPASIAPGERHPKSGNSLSLAGQSGIGICSHLGLFDYPCCRFGLHSSGLVYPTSCK